MRIGPFEIPPKNKKETTIKPKIEEMGNSILAKNKEIYSVLTDPEFIKTFPGPTDSQYDLLRDSLLSSYENALNGTAYLKDYLEKTKNPLFSQIRFSQFLHTALGGQKELSKNNKEQEKITKVLERGLANISNEDNIKYFLGVTLKPEIVLSPVNSFSGIERGLTPVQIDNNYFIQDNGFDPIPIIYHIDNPDGFKKVISKMKQFFESARPENRPELTQNATLSEMKNYKNKYLSSAVNFTDRKNNFKNEINSLAYRLNPEEIQEFFSGSKNTYELTKDPMVFEFRSFVDPKIRATLQKEFGVNFIEIPLKEQIYFLTTISNSTNETIKPIKAFTQKFGAIGLRTFLSIEQGGKEMGNKIMELGEKLPEDVAHKIFSKYGEIVDVANNAEEEVKKLYERENIPNEVFVSIKEKLLKRGAHLLLDLSNELKESKIIPERDILKQLEDIKTETIIMGDSYVELYKKGIKVSIEDVSNTIVEKKSSENLTNEEKEELLDTYEKGRPKETYENKDHLKLLEDEFKESLNDKDTYIFNIRFKGEIIAFVTFYKLNEDTFHIGGLTFIEGVRNPVVAESVMNSIIEEFCNFNIKALVHSENKILPMYQKRFGFKIVKELPREENAGELYYEIERPKNKKEEELKIAA